MLGYLESFTTPVAKETVDQSQGTSTPSSVVNNRDKCFVASKHEEVITVTQLYSPNLIHIVM